MHWVNIFGFIGACSFLAGQATATEWGNTLLVITSLNKGHACSVLAGQASVIDQRIGILFNGHSPWWGVWWPGGVRTVSCLPLA